MTILGNRILHISNAGLLIKNGGKQVLVDALHEQLKPYPGTPQTVARAILTGEPPFERIDAMIITHEHRDHFDPALVTEFCRARPSVPVFSNAHVIQILEDRLPLATCLYRIEPELYGTHEVRIDEMGIRFMRLKHMGKGYETVCNLSCVIEAERAVAHVGDAEGDADNLHACRSIMPEKSIVCAPFPYATLPASLQLVRQCEPALLYLIHLPAPDQDRFNWLQAVRRVCAAENGIPVIPADTCECLSL